MLLKKFSVENYRNLKAFEIADLARVNLITGKNNAGKTSFLEALYLFERNCNPLAIKDILTQREEWEEGESGMSNEAVMACLLNNKMLVFSDFLIFNAIYNKNTTSNKTILKLLNEYNGDLTDWRYDPDSFQLDIDDENVKFTMNRKDFKFFEALDSIVKYVYYDSNLLKNMASEWDKIVLSPKEDMLEEMLRIVEPRIKRLSFTEIAKGKRRAVVRLENENKPFPLGSMGDAMNRILALALALANAEGGVLLYDEIENGLHYSIQEKIWDFILDASEKYDIQVFATTHSLDMLRAFQKSLEKRENKTDLGKVYRLEAAEEGRVDAIAYDTEELKIASKLNIEVR